MAHAAFSCNLQSRWAPPRRRITDRHQVTDEVQDVAFQQAVDELRSMSAHIVKAEGKHVRLEFLVRTSEGRFKASSSPGEAVEDLFARIAKVALMPGHGGLENASVRALKDISSLDTCEFKKSLSWQSDASTSAGSDDSGSSEDSDVDSVSRPEQFARKVSGVRFSGFEEKIFFIADAKQDKLPEDKSTDPDLTVDKVMSFLSFM